MFLIMQITAFKAMWRENNITGCEDYENTFSRIESDCTFRFGVKVLMKSISYTKQSNLFLHFLSTSKRFSSPEGSSSARSCNVWQWRRTVVYVPLHDCVNVRVFNLHSLHHTGHIGNYKLQTVHLRSVALLLSHSVLVQFSDWQTKAGWWCLLLGSDA